ncbi:MULTISPECIES: SDR family NAD(P)-dependent oxidoreductase [Streptomyces]|uniref:SDR family NAD(P)-dependent oxidoreductase n=1 Tax=Streptomyces TaxID=1883 RepID=UPI000995EBDD|nr:MULTISPECIES: SDR family oxidoreductase [Streptomyces]AQW47625.1 oxidoreductase [Streptomyces hygroscopicus]ASQ92702.1 NAD(P)-dependent oxidoreductase [Streptomyces sp. 11-1-2]
MRGLQGKRIVVAGGATGIGAATAERLAEEGASVVVGDINLVGAKATSQRIAEAGGTAVAVEFDLADEESIGALVDRAAAEFGGVDGLYNVGADLSDDHLGRDTDLLEMDPALWRRTHEVNLLGYALTCRAVIPRLLAQGGGVIVNTSSGAAWGGEPRRPAYAASKAGINALTRHIASRWGKEGIRCNAVAPGLVMGDTQKQRDDQRLQAMALKIARSPRLGEPADVAGTVAFLLSDDAEWVNGQVWSVCGGMSLRD